MMSLTEQDLARIEARQADTSEPDRWPVEIVNALVAEVRRLRANPLLAATCRECSQSLDSHIAYQDGYVMFYCDGQLQGLSGILLRLADARAEPRPAPAVDTGTGRWEKRADGTWQRRDAHPDFTWYPNGRLYAATGYGDETIDDVTPEDLRDLANIIEREQA